MSARRHVGEYPNLQVADFFPGGSLFLWRNPADRPFKDSDVWTLTVPWDTTDELDEAYGKLQDKESELAAHQAFAWNSDFGFLSPIPNHCGTGLGVEGEFHLEALHLIGDLSPVLNAVQAVRFQSANIVEDGIRQAAHLFRIRNEATLGISEKDLLARARHLFEELALQERNARKALVEEMPRILEDAIMRSLALLRSARLLAPGEYLDLLSPIRLGVTMGFLEGITRSETFKLMREQLNSPELPPARTAEDDRRRDARDARLADRANSRFAHVHFSSLAEEYFS